MKKLALFTLLFTTLSFLSCDKNDDITIVLDESGSLELKIVDNDNAPIENAVVTLSSYYDAGALLSNEKTDASGSFNFDKILQGTYRCAVSVVKDGKKYSTESLFQVFARNHRIVEINPFKNVSKVKLSVKIDGTVNDITKYVAAIIPASPLPYPKSVEEIQKMAYASTNLNETGVAEFPEVPSDYNYYMCIYKDNNIYITSHTSNVKERDHDMFLSFAVSELETTSKGVADNSKYDVYIISSSYRTNDDIDLIKKHASFSGKLGSKFAEIPHNTDYLAYLIKDEIIYDKVEIPISSPEIGKLIPVSFRVGSITASVTGSVSDPTKYTVAVVPDPDYDPYLTDVDEIKSKAIALGNLDADASKKMTDLYLLSYSRFHVYLIKDKIIYGVESVNIYPIEESKSVSFRVESITVNVRGAITNPTEYTVAAVLNSNYNPNIDQIKSNAVATGNLNAEANKKFELPNKYLGSFLRLYIYKGNEIYSSREFYWSSQDTSMNLDMSVIEY